MSARHRVQDRASRGRLRRSRMSFDEQIAMRPLPQNAVGAFCVKCQHVTDSEQIVEEKRGVIHNSCSVLVKCHGEEELGEFVFASSTWDSTDLKRAMQRRAWFATQGHEGIAGIVNGGVIND